MKIRDVLRVVCDRDASDVFLKVDNVPYMRVYGELVPMMDFSVLGVSDLQRIVSEIANEAQRKMLQTALDTDYAMDIDSLDPCLTGTEKSVALGLARFRVSIFMQRGVPSIVMRRIKKAAADFPSLNLPQQVMESLCQEKRGLVLLTGPAGHGKSTTIASMIEYMNTSQARHILTVEDPIEFTFTDKKSVINQRELGLDVSSYPVALRQVTLQSPDVIFIGTIRDLETMSAALNAAEMGILVLSTVHTVNAAQTAQRILNFFPPHQHAEIRMQLSFLLKGVVSLRLVPRVDGSGRIPACETMVLTPTISRLLREGAFTDITRFLEEGALFGMQSFKQSLAKLVKENKITPEEAYKYADSREDLDLEIKGIKRLM
ncbi:MAG: PilT/PilU family type 4a pilus ATPase [Candidatus Omnitrophica bacterium]|nr:PilT/PilU family type 4a pilus ATPase [Candidatus Omnitrophota bacterium]MDD5574273.1 PilT/PilU family type 4a pilus ATPase [Candidatus Omnitrophota bacterium]